MMGFSILCGVTHVVTLFVCLYLVERPIIHDMKIIYPNFSTVWAHRLGLPTPPPLSLSMCAVEYLKLGSVFTPNTDNNACNYDIFQQTSQPSRGARVPVAPGTTSGTQVQSCK